MCTYEGGRKHAFLAHARLEILLRGRGSNGCESEVVGDLAAVGDRVVGVSARKT